jgi:ATPase subunit of ABC transporter with duplicated ATPase domains
VIVASGIAMQFGTKPLFSDVSVKFGGGNRYGLIGANGCGKSTFMKILGGELEPSAGTVAIDSNERVGRLRQDQFTFEDQRVLDVVLQGHAEMWASCCARQVSRDAYFLTANTPSPFSFAANPACCSRLATSLGTSRPLVSLFGVPV